MTEAERDNAEGKGFPVKISRRLSLSLSLFYLLVLVVGGLSLLSARFISRGIEEVRKEGHSIELMEEMHVGIHHLIREIDRAVITGVADRIDHTRSLVENLEGGVARFLKLREKEGEGSPEWKREINLIKEIKGLIADLGLLSGRIMATVMAGGRVSRGDLESLDRTAQRIPLLSQQCNEIHQRRMRELIQRSQSRMSFIVNTYFAFVLLGSLLIGAVSLLFSRTISRPLQRLAEATFNIAHGDYRKRVEITSRGEIGRLAQSFNLMAEELEKRDKEAKRFYEELERRVKERTRELEEATERFIRAERAATIGQIAAGVTHEIRTPLSALAINLELLGRELSKEPFSKQEALEALALIKREMNRANEVLEEFVRFARRPKPALGPVEVNFLIQEAAGLLEGQARRTGVALDLRLLDDLPAILGDRDQLREVILNLGLNAIQAMPNGGTLRIETGIEKGQGEGSPGSLLIQVSDTGVGIPQQDLPRIFEPFFSTKDHGLGLGLAIARGIVEEHNGIITCRSREGFGTTFEVKLPIPGASMRS